MTCAVIDLAAYRAARVPRCRECHRPSSSPWCNVCTDSLEIRLRDHRRRCGDRCTGCGNGIEPRTSLGFDARGYVYHKACALLVGYPDAEGTAS